MTETPPPVQESPANPPPQPPIADKGKSGIRIPFWNIVVLVFLAYAAYQQVTKPDDEAKNRVARGAIKTEEGGASDPKASASAAAQDPLMDQLLGQENFNSFDMLIPRIRTSVLTKTLKEGEGRKAFCGQIATYQLTKKGEKKTRIITSPLANASDILSQYLVWGIEGMRVGETREIRMPQQTSQPLLAVDTPSDIEVYQVVLQNISPEMPKAGAMPLRRFLIKGDAAYDFRCGDIALFHLTLRDAKGTVIFTSLGSKPVFAVIGAGKGIPAGLEMALQEMGPGGEYTLILPPELSLPLHQKGELPTIPEGVEAQPYPAELLVAQQHVLIADIQIPRHLLPKQEEN